QQAFDDEAEWRESERLWHEHLAEQERKRQQSQALAAHEGGAGILPAHEGVAFEPSHDNHTSPREEPVEPPPEPPRRDESPCGKRSPRRPAPWEVITSEEALRLPWIVNEPSTFPPAPTWATGPRPERCRVPEGWAAPWPNGDFVFPGDALAPP